MKAIAISDFKAKCLSVLEQVRATGQPVLVTRRGVPVARLLPPEVPEAPLHSTFGCMAGSSKELADIVEPLRAEDWEALT